MSQVLCAESLQQRFYQWRLFKRGGVYYADGRNANQKHLKKYSLGTREKKLALEALRQLDESLAVKAGLIDRVAAMDVTGMEIVRGWELFMEHCSRPPILGGVSPNTFKRYRAVRDKHLAFCRERGLSNWSEINRKTTGA